MINNMRLTFFVFSVSINLLASEVKLQDFSAEDSKEISKNTRVKYKEAGRIDFESLLIEGERKKPELSVVTGNVGEKDNGLLIIRKDFKDMMANDFGEVIE